MENTRDTTKNMELKSVNVVSIFLFFGGIFLIMGLIFGLFGNFLKIDVKSIEFISAFPYVAKLNPGILTGIVFGVICGLSAGVAFSVFALLYNFFAAIFGGLKFTMKL